MNDTAQGAVEDEPQDVAQDLAFGASGPGRRAPSSRRAPRLVYALELVGARLGARRERVRIAAVGVVAQGTHDARAQPLLQHATQTVNEAVARLSDGPQLHLQPLPQISDAGAQRTAAVANCGKDGRYTARQCRPLSMCDLIRLTHHHEQGRALRAIGVVRGRLVITKLRHGCTGDGAHVRVVAHERRAGLTNSRVGHVGTGKDSRVQAGSTL